MLSMNGRSTSVSIPNTVVFRKKSESTSSETFVEDNLHNSSVLTTSPTQEQTKPNLLPGNDDNNDSGISESSCEESKLVFEQHQSDETSRHSVGICQIFLQIFFPFIIAGGGMMLAGMLLDYVQHFKVFEVVPELFILVPALLGLKGNLEMTLASRLSTAANLGNMDTCKTCWSLIWGNLTLIQGQALVVALIATLTSIVLNLISGQKLHFSHVFLIGGSSMSAACIASALLSLLMMIIVILSRPLRIDPDNVATPIAASLGDLVTLCILSSIAIGLFKIKDETIIVSSILCGILILLIPVWLSLAYCNSSTRSVLYSGWVPVISAMVISSLGGLVLAKTVTNFPGIAVYSPIINGMGGNLGAVQASRICTHLHLGSSSREPSANPQYKWSGIIGTFWKGNHSKTSLLLLSMVIPASSLFLILIRYTNAGHTTLSPMFFFSYLMVAVTQAAILLIITDWIVHFIFWKLCVDPDNFAIPFITALGDLLGTGLLAAAFHILWYLGDKDSDVGE